jgi:putative heme iron utilization protein
MSETANRPERDDRPEGTEPPAAAARRILKSVPMASLATLAATADGWPYASLVACAVGHDGTPALLLSELADHTRNLRADPRASLLLDNTAGLANRMAGERLTLMGRLAPVEDAVLRRRYLARHPGAAHYADFADFALWAMTVERAHLVGGFANAHWLEAAAVLAPLPEAYALTEAETGILEHMNADHRDAIDVYANHLARRGGQGWRLTGIDREGIDLRRAGETARVAFPAPVDDGEAAKEALIELVARARAVAAGRTE